MQHEDGFHYGRLKNGNQAGNPNLARRCGAHRKNGLPCRAPAVRGKRVCRMHGARGGPKTQQGIEAIRRARTKHGFFSAASKAERRSISAMVREIRSAMAKLEGTPSV